MVAKLQTSLQAKAKADPAYRFYALWDKVSRKDVLREAYERSRRNAGASGVDRQTFEQIETEGVEPWLETLRQDYVRTARAKGQIERIVLFRHAFRNALLPLITVLGLVLPGLLSGSVIIEKIFAWPGLGRLYFDSILSRDYPVVLALSLLGAVATLLFTLGADVAYALADPRVRDGTAS